MKLLWDKLDEREFETGADHGVLYPVNQLTGDYDTAHVWNGLTTVTESPTGAEATPQYADNQIYLNLISVEKYAGTIECFTYPDAFAACNGEAEPEPGVTIGQQPRQGFGFSWRTKVGNALNAEAGYKLHLVWGALSAPSEKAHTTVNDTPAAMPFSFGFTTTPIEVPGFHPSASMTINSLDVDATALATLEDALYGTSGADAYLPSPAAVLAMFGGTVTTVTTVAPTYNASTDIITIPTVAGVEYLVDGEVVPSGAYGPITADTVVTARPTAGHRFSDTSDDDWTIVYS